MDKIEFKVKNMDCPSCENAITKRLKALEGVKAVETDFQTKKVVIQHNNPNLCQDDVTCVVEDMGYKVQAL